MSRTMTSVQRVSRALNFEPPDYVPLFDQYWGGFVTVWRSRHGLPARTDIPLDDIVYDDELIYSYFHVDMYKAIPNEDPWPSSRRELRREAAYIIERDGWGRTMRRKATSPYGMPLELALMQRSDLDRLEFESADLEHRYQKMLASIDRVQHMPDPPYIFIKIGGPYLRSSFLRGEYQWFVDIAEDPAFAAAVATRVTDHLIAVGTEALRRSQLSETSIWIFDDIASNNGLLVSPTSYERLFLPQVRRMAQAFKEMGAAHVGYHSDGDIRAVLDGLVDAGISILNPIEPRANMDVVELRRRYGRRLACVGGLCNSLILPYGSDCDVRSHVEHALSVADEGGLVIGSHSISNDVTQERYDLLMDILHEHGRPRPGPAHPPDGLGAPSRDGLSYSKPLTERSGN
jgi:uroporphyrinogen decarboxylase